MGGLTRPSNKPAAIAQANNQQAAEEAKKQAEADKAKRDAELAKETQQKSAVLDVQEQESKRRAFANTFLTQEGEDVQRKRFLKAV